MHVALCGTLLCIVISSILPSRGIIHHYQPFGIKMCNRLRSRLTIPLSCSFAHSHLSCDVVRMGHVSETQGQFKSNVTHRKCGKYSEIIFSRNRDPVCVRYTPRRPRRDKKIGRDTTRDLLKPTRLLVGAKGKDYSNYSRFSFQQFRPEENDTSIYPHIGPHSVSAMVYVKRLGKLAIAVHMPPLVALISLDGAGNDILRSNILCSDIAVDDEKNLLFLACNGTVGRMSINGELYRDIFQKTKTTFVAIALNTKRKTIYVSDEQTLWSIDYNGQNKKALFNNQLFTIVVVDPILNLLYFNIHNVLLKTSTALEERKPLKQLENITVLVHAFPQVPLKALLFNNYIYVTLDPSRKPAIVVLDQHLTVQTNVKKTLRNPFRKPVAQICMCPIP